MLKHQRAQRMTSLHGPSGMMQVSTHEDIKFLLTITHGPSPRGFREPVVARRTTIQLLLKTQEFVEADCSTCVDNEALYNRGRVRALFARGARDGLRKARVALPTIQAVRHGLLLAAV